MVVRNVLLALAFFCSPSLFAHPLDDKADMASSIAILDDTTLELALEFRYRDVRASYAELAAGLDRNQDGTVTRQEVKLRFFDIIDPLVLAITVNVGGRQATLEPDASRFEFRDLNNEAANVDAPEGIPTHSTRIFYRFVIVARASPGTGLHEVEYFFSGPQAVVHSPATQMLVFDDRRGRQPVPGARWDTDTGGMPRVRFAWQVGPVSAAGPTVSQAAEVAGAGDPDLPARSIGLGEVPAWLTLLSGVGLAIAGFALVARRALGSARRGRLSNALMLLGAGVAIILGALMRLGYLRPL